MQTEQLGGRPKAPVTLGVHLGRAFLRARRSQGHNVAMLYLDLMEAFYRILRPLVTGGPVSDEIVMHVGRKLGFTEDLLEELYKHLSEPAAIAEANLPKHMQIAINALHEDTFFTVKGQGDVCRTTLGSRPGDCFADVIFSYLWGRTLKRLQATLIGMHIDDKIPMDASLSLLGPRSEASRSFLGPTWMDDTCVCVSDPSPQTLEAKIHPGNRKALRSLRNPRALTQLEPWQDGGSSGLSRTWLATDAHQVFWAHLGQVFEDHGRKGRHEGEGGSSIHTFGLRHSPSIMIRGKKRADASAWHTRRLPNTDAICCRIQCYLCKDVSSSSSPWYGVA